MKRVGLDKIRELLPKLDSRDFSPEVFDLTGIFVIRQAIPAPTVRNWQLLWSTFYEEITATGRSVNKFNPVAVDETPPPDLANIHQHPAILDIVEKAFGPDIGLYNQRFVIKDCNSRGPVFLHNDFGYHLGWPNKASAFVPLSEVTPQNGGLTFYPGTHHFGYLGDVGEINPSFIDPNWPTISPCLTPGDVALMNSCTWHTSGPHVSGPDRVMADIIYQPASDPSCVALLRGQWLTELFLHINKRQEMFRRSRSSQLKELQRRLDERDPQGSSPKPG